MIRVCLDTNVLISALVFGGKPVEILTLAAEEEVVLVSSPQILAEFAKTLKEKFSWVDGDIRQALKTLTAISVVVTPKKKIHKINYESDNRILECAVEGRVNFLVTGDKKHLLPLKSFDDIQIISPDEFLRKIDFHIS